MAVAAVLLVSRFGVSITFVHGPSMEPTLGSGQVVVLNRLAGEIGPGEIVVTDRKNPFDEILIKRVIAVGGQTLTVQGSQIWVDGQLLTENYLQDPDWDGFTLELTVPADSYFLLGDNRNESRDSREIGCIHRDNLLGRIVQ